MNDNEQQHPLERHLDDLASSAIPDATDLRPALHRRLAERHSSSPVGVDGNPPARSPSTHAAPRPTRTPRRLIPAIAIALSTIGGLALLVVQPWDTPVPDGPDTSWAAFSEESLLAMQHLEYIAEHGLDSLPLPQELQQEDNHDATPTQP